MKRVFIFLGFLLMFVDAQAIFGKIKYIIPLSADSQSIHSAYYYSAILDYTSGGTVFAYTSEIFTQSPIVRVSVVLKNATYSTSEVYVPVIVSNDATSATIRVNKVKDNGILGTSIDEAATNDVTLHLLAVGV